MTTRHRVKKTAAAVGAAAAPASVVNEKVK